MKRIVGIYAATPFQIMNGINVARNYLKADACMLFLREKMWDTTRSLRIMGKDPFVKGMYAIKEAEPISRAEYLAARFEGFCIGQFSKEYPYFYETYKSKPLRMPKFSAIVCNKNELYWIEQYKRIFHYEPDSYLIEDGTGDYLCEPQSAESSFQRIFYCAEFYNKIYCRHILTAPKISAADDQMTRIFDNLFNITAEIKTKIENVRCIYFQQKLMGNPIFDALEEKICRLLENKYKNQFLLKLHVRETKTSFQGVRTLNTLIPFEALYPHIKNREGLVLVGITTTTLLTPKLMFGENTMAISLHNILLQWESAVEKQRRERLRDLFSYVKSEYDDPCKFMIPQTEEELSAWLDSL